MAGVLCLLYELSHHFYYVGESSQHVQLYQEGRYAVHVSQWVPPPHGYLESLYHFARRGSSFGQQRGHRSGVYSGVFVFLSLVWNLLWRYASGGHRLVSSAVPEAVLQKATRDFNIGTLLYVVAFALAFVSGIASIIAILLLAVFWAVTAPTRSAERKGDAALVS